jgi:hypothetical protein
MKTESVPTALPVFNDYVIDFENQVLRKAVKDRSVEIIPFSSKKGVDLLFGYLDELFLRLKNEAD